MPIGRSVNEDWVPSKMCCDPIKENQDWRFHLANLAKDGETDESMCERSLLISKKVISAPSSAKLCALLAVIWHEKYDVRVKFRDSNWTQTLWVLLLTNIYRDWFGKYIFNSVQYKVRLCSLWSHGCNVVQLRNILHHDTQSFCFVTKQITIVRSYTSIIFQF